MKLPALPFVRVEWDDAWTDNESVTLHAAQMSHAPLRVQTMGYVLVDDADGMMLASENHGDSYRGRTFIPRAMIRDVKKYRLAQVREAKRERDRDASVA